jgi:hypothetical protein
VFCEFHGMSRHFLSLASIRNLAVIRVVARHKRHERCRRIKRYWSMSPRHSILIIHCSHQGNTERKDTETGQSREKRIDAWPTVSSSLVDLVPARKKSMVWFADVIKKGKVCLDRCRSALATHMRLHGPISSRRRKCLPSSSKSLF